MGSSVYLLFIGLHNLVASEGTLIISPPNQMTCAISFGLVIIYLLGKRAYYIYKVATRKTEYPLQSFVMDFIRENLRRS